MTTEDVTGRAEPATRGEAEPAGWKDGRVQPVLVRALGKGRVRYASGVRAGRWMFATGHMAQDFTSGVDASVVNARNPHGDAPRHEKEAARIFDHIEEALKAGGASLENVVRLDQYYPHQRAVDPYHVVRRQRFKKYVPPSTSMLINRLLLMDARIEVQAVAVVPDSGAGPVALDDPALRAPVTSGFSPAVVANGFAFLPGLVATPAPGGAEIDGLAAEACLPPGSLWKGEPIKLEAEHLITNKIVPSLRLSGCELSSVVKAQAYLTDIDDAAAFLSVWNRHFDEWKPALTIIACPNPAIGIAAARLEINIIARAGDGSRRAVSVPGLRSYNRQPLAVHAADLLFCSGLMAADDLGLLDDVAVEAGQPFFADSVELQAHAILERAEKICAAAGTDISQVVRAQMFLTSIADFYSAYRAWQRIAPGLAIPFSAVEVPTLPVPGARVQMDLWFYAPDRSA